MSEAGERIAAEIRDRGAITFARFMELALYCPDCGYYERERDMIGRRGDYYTSVSVGGLFGELLAFQFAEWLQQIHEGDTGHLGPGSARGPEEARPGLRIVEAGAHSGDMAGDILGWMREHRPGLFGLVEYCIVEPSDRRRERQRHKLREFKDKVCWVKKLPELIGLAASAPRVGNSGGLRGVLFANELLDAMPVRRFWWNAKARVWFEWGVTLQDERFAWTRIPHGEPGGGDAPASADSALPHVHLPEGSRWWDTLPDGFTTELSPAAEEWWRAAARILDCGKLVTIDYGLTAEAFFVPERNQGTLRGYRDHRLTDDLLAAPGEQDLTAHVNFTAVQAAGESVGLKTESFVSQSEFLTRIVARIWKGQSAFGDWTGERTRQLQTLIHPEHLGRSFRVLVQARPTNYGGY